MKTKFFGHSIVGCLFLAAFATQAQVPQLINFQGRVVVGTANFDGAGRFKFALVNGNGAATYWSNDGTSTAGSQPANAVVIPVTRGLYSVLLGDATLPGMTLLPATVFTNADLRLRVWFNDGTNGFQQFSPDQRIAAVGYAIMAGNVPDAAITAAKLAEGAVTPGKLSPEVKASLSGVPGGGVVLSESPNATNLLNAGFVQLAGAKLKTEEWEELLAETDVSYGDWEFPPIWTGKDVYLFGDQMMPDFPLFVRYDAELNVWQDANTNGAPNMPSRYLWMDGELAACYVASVDAVHMFAAIKRYHPKTDTWTDANTNGAPSSGWMSSAWAWTGTEVIALSGSPEGSTGGRYRPASDSWASVNTNGMPDLSDSFWLFWTGDRLLVIVSGPTEFSGGIYSPQTDSWVRMKTSGAVGFGMGQWQSVWTGTELIVVAGDPVGLFQGASYSPAMNRWSAIDTYGAPRTPGFQSVVLWTGTEVLVWTSGDAAMPGESAGGLYNPKTDTWRTMNPAGDDLGFSTPNAPSVVWTGTEMIVGPYLRDTAGTSSIVGARYNPATDHWSLISKTGAPTFSQQLASTFWTGQSLLVFEDTMAMGTPRLVKYTPSRSLFIYQKP